MQERLFSESIKTNRELKEVVEKRVGDYDKKVSDLEKLSKDTLAKQQKQVDGFKGELDGKAKAIADSQQKWEDDHPPELRHHQLIDLREYDTDMLYPIWWSFPSNETGTGKITISRSYWTDKNVLHPTHNAALLLELEGIATGWSGDANFMEVKRFHERYYKTASHIGFMLPTLKKRIRSSEDSRYGATVTGYVNDEEHELFTDSTPRYSGLYLRGGYQYQVHKNWSGNVGYLGKNEAEKVLHIYDAGEPKANVIWLVRPIPFSKLNQNYTKSTKAFAPEGV